jgi:hypothetical protein
MPHPGFVVAPLGAPRRVGGRFGWGIIHAREAASVVAFLIGVPSFSYVNEPQGATMPSDIRIIHAHEFIEATPDGKLDLERTKKMLIEIASASAPSNDYDVLVDTRDAHAEMDAGELWELAAELHKYREALSRKTAVVVAASQSDYAGFFALCARERGFQVSAFTSLGDAMEWLTGTWTVERR